MKERKLEWDDEMEDINLTLVNEARQGLYSFLVVSELGFLVSEAELGSSE